MVQYVCLVYHDEDAFEEAYRGKLDALGRESFAYDRKLEEAGKLVLAHALQAEPKSKVVRSRRKRLVTDGPFTESKEQLIGFIVVEAKDMDEAVELAAGIPLARTGTIVVRATYSPD